MAYELKDEYGAIYNVSDSAGEWINSLRTRLAAAEKGKRVAIEDAKRYRERVKELGGRLKKMDEHLKAEQRRLCDEFDRAEKAEAERDEAKMELERYRENFGYLCAGCPDCGNMDCGQPNRLDQARARVAQLEKAVRELVEALIVPLAAMRFEARRQKEAVGPKTGETNWPGFVERLDAALAPFAGIRGNDAALRAKGGE